MAQISVHKLNVHNNNSYSMSLFIELTDVSCVYTVLVIGCVLCVARKSFLLKFIKSWNVGGKSLLLFIRGLFVNCSYTHYVVMLSVV